MNSNVFTGNALRFSQRQLGLNDAMLEMQHFAAFAKLCYIAFSKSSTAFSDVDKGAAVLQSGRKQILKIGKNVPPSLLFDLYPQKVKYCIPLFLFWYFVAGIDTNCKDKALFC